jgi:hypothetical protein
VISTNFGQEIIWHNGATPGDYNALMAFNSTTERGVVILTSADVTNNHISEIMFNQKYKISNLITGLLNH